jgi:RimJ/RimL family protein N-acetyltransferase
VSELSLRRGGIADIPFVMQTERLPGYWSLLGHWEEERHLAALAGGSHAYFVGIVEGGPIGFAIVRDWNAPSRVSLVQRLAVCEPGRGIGTRLTAAVADAVFTQTNAHRLAIGTFPDNLRARRAYEAVGFVAEGVSRGSAFFHGEYRDELVLALLRPDWEARRGDGQPGPALP